ncbi:MAG: hypothetical protein ACMXYK_02455 [Candidatus Woesearchaeota archaeon]
MAEFQLFGALVMGLIVSLIEIFFVHEDEAGLGWMKHAAHAVPVCFILTFIAMNVPYAMNLAQTQLGWAWLTGPLATFGIPVLMGIIATVKVKAAAAITTGRSAIGEKFVHALIVGVIIAASPFIWPLVQPMVPAFLNF